MAQKDEGKHVTVAGKISVWAYGRLLLILKSRCITIYQMIQNMVDCIIRYMSDKHNLTPESEKVMAMYEHMIGWEDNFNLADPSAKPQIAEATYYMTDQNGKKGVRVMHVERPIMGKWTQNFNVQQILDKFLGFAFPQLYKQLRYIAGCRECATILELLIEVVTELEAEEDKKMMKSLFEDAERSEWGKHMHDTPPKRRKNVTPDMFESEYYKEKINEEETNGSDTCDDYPGESTDTDV